LVKVAASKEGQEYHLSGFEASSALAWGVVVLELLVVQPGSSAC